MKHTYFPLFDLHDNLLRYVYHPDNYTGDRYEGVISSLLLLHKAIADYMLTEKEDAILKRYMNTLLEQLRVIFDDIPTDWIGDLDPEDPPAFSDSTSWHKNVCFECFRLIKEIQIQYPGYFNANATPPRIYTEIELSVHQYKVMIITQWMETNGFQHHPLWRIVNTTIQQLWHRGNFRYNYHELDYIWTIVDQLKTDVSSATKKFKMDDLYTMLFYFNFNSTAFYNHLTTGLLNDINDTTDLAAKLKAIESIEAFAENMLVRNDFAYDPGHPPINVMVKRWSKIPRLSSEL
jgi:hypothetical protein